MVNNILKSYGIDETISCINKIIRESEDIFQAIKMLEDLRTCLRYYKEIKNI